MKIAYVFSTANCQKILDKMIIPQMLEGNHGAEVAGMMFFFDNTFLLTEGSGIGDKLQKIHEKYGTLLMACDLCAIERGIENRLVPGAGIGCFPNLYAALAPAAVDQIVTL